MPRASIPVKPARPPTHAVAALWPFRGARGPDVESLVERLEEVSFDKGATMALQGEPASYGLIEVTRRVPSHLDPDKRDLGELWPSSVLGDGALFGKNRTHLVTVTAPSPYTALKITREALRSHANSPPVAAL